MRHEIAVLCVLLAMGSILFVTTTPPEKLKFSVIWSVITLMVIFAIAVVALIRKPNQ